MTPNTTTATAPRTLVALQQWLEVNGGYLNPKVRLEQNEASGVHCRAISDLEANARICTVPHSLAVSSLNALVDDGFPVFRNRGLAVEAIGYFYLMHQYIHREESFWQPYLDSLPAPNGEHSTPFWFDAEDTAWLEDTDVLHTTKARQNVHEEHYRSGLAMLERAGVSTAPYTWHLFKWAVFIYTSRSFSSRSLRPQESKYWSAHKTGQHGRRQTVLMDMSKASAEELDFPVLFPVVDIPNHAHDAMVDWTFDPGRFSINIKHELPTGAEVFNNYGPKSNDELLLGYGFCIAGNPFDKVLLTLKAPPEQLQPDIRKVQPGYFAHDGRWNSEKATFHIEAVKLEPGQPPEILFANLPEPLLELMVYMLRFERGLAFEFLEHPIHYITAAGSPGRQYRPHLTRMIVTSLLPKLAKLHASTPKTGPITYRQQQAKLYRDGQVRILESITAGLRLYLRSLLYPNPSSPKGPMVVTLEGLLEVLRIRGGVKLAKDFLDGIAVSAGTTQSEQLREAGWEDEVFVLMLCWVYTCCHMESATPEYLLQPASMAPLSPEDLEQARSSLELVEAAAEACPNSFWQDPRWSAEYIAGLGGRLLRYESFAMMVPVAGADDSGDARLVFYVHE